MSASKLITLHLGKNGIKFEIVKHRKVYTAYDLAQTLGTKLDQIAKTLLIRAEVPTLTKKEERYYVVVIPASYYLEFAKLKKLLGAKSVSIVPEKMMKKFGIEPGALSPFGSLRGFGVAIDKALLGTKDAFVGAESFTESLRMKVKDLVKLEQPFVGSFGKKNAMKLQPKAKPAKKPKKGKRPAKKVAKKTQSKRVAKKVATKKPLRGKKKR